MHKKADTMICNKQEKENTIFWVGKNVSGMSVREKEFSFIKNNVSGKDLTW